MKSERRNTKQRTAILDLLMSTKTHPTAAWLHERLKPDFPGLSLGTVYRNLSVLDAEGRILTLESGTGIDRFDADTSRHYHVVCTACGRVDDVPFGTGESPAADEGREASSEAGDQARSIAPPDIRDSDAERASGYRITAHRLDFFGICPACLNGQREKNGSV